MFFVAPFFLSPTINLIKSCFESNMTKQSKQYTHSMLALFFVTVFRFDLLDMPQAPMLAIK
jgi:hypothetical protein